MEAAKKAFEATLENYKLEQRVGLLNALAELESQKAAINKKLDAIDSITSLPTDTYSGCGAIAKGIKITKA